MSDSDEDPIVQELPAYLTQEFKESLYLFQFPVMKGSLHTGPMQVIKSSIKPANKQVQMELAVDVNSVNYDLNRAEQIALDVDGPGTGKDEKMFTRGFLDRTSLQSVRSVPDAGRYAIALVQNGEVHLNPLEGCVELRNYLPYLDAGDKRSREAARAKGTGGEDEEEEQPKQITVKFARQENERVKRARERSFSYLTQKSAEEPWYSTKFHPEHSQKSECLRERLQCTVHWESPQQLGLEPAQYRELLCTAPSVDEPTANPLVVTLRHLRQLPLAERVRHLMRRGKVLAFNEILELLQGSCEPAEVVRTLQPVAVLVHGNWVLKSEEMFPTEATYRNGLTAEDMCRGRDHVLCLLALSSSIHMDTLRKDVQLPYEDLKEILEQVACVEPAQGWRFRLPHDGDFIARFPEVAQRQQVMWEALARHK